MFYIFSINIDGYDNDHSLGRKYRVTVVQGVRELLYNFDLPANCSKSKYQVLVFCIVWRKSAILLHTIVLKLRHLFLYTQAKMQNLVKIKTISLKRYKFLGGFVATGMNDTKF